MEERKSALIEALAAKCGALLELQQAGSAAAGQHSTAAAALAAAAGAGAGAAAGEASAPAGGAAAATGGGVDSSKGASKEEAAAASAFEEAFRELRKWVDTAADEKVSRGWPAVACFACFAMFRACHTTGGGGAWGAFATQGGHHLLPTACLLRRPVTRAPPQQLRGTTLRSLLAVRAAAC